MAEDPPREGADDDGSDRSSTGPASSADDDRAEPGWNAEPGEREWVEMPESRDRDRAETEDGPVVEDDPESDEDEEDPYAPEPSSAPVTPGQPSLENALFVALGALATIVVLFRVFSLGFG